MELISGDDPPTPAQEENIEWWAAQLYDYAHRAWRLCGVEQPIEPEAPQ